MPIRPCPHGDFSNGCGDFSVVFTLATPSNVAHHGEALFGDLGERRPLTSELQDQGEHLGGYVRAKRCGSRLALTFGQVDGAGNNVLQLIVECFDEGGDLRVDVER